MNNNIKIQTHPLIKHKITLLRKVETGTNEFRQLVEEIAMLMAFDALRDLPTEDVEVQTPIETCLSPEISGKKLAIIPVLRAGLGMVEGVIEVLPTAKIGHVGMYRNEETYEPINYFFKVPKDIEKREAIILDPMLATGGSACDAIELLKEKGVKKIKFLCIISAPEGLQKVNEKYPDVKIYTACIDDHLNKNKYIVPGLGDAGDRIFGTK